MNCARTVLVCQNKACRKGGSARVLEAFQAHLSSQASAPPLSAEVVSSPCLGQCGNGPMVLVNPDAVWYHRVSPEEVEAIVERHLRKGQPVQAMLYRKFHTG